MGRFFQLIRLTFGCKRPNATVRLLGNFKLSATRHWASEPNRSAFTCKRAFGGKLKSG